MHIQKYLLRTCSHCSELIHLALALIKTNMPGRFDTKTTSSAKGRFATPEVKKQAPVQQEAKTSYLPARKSSDPKEGVIANLPSSVADSAKGMGVGALKGLGQTATAMSSFGERLMRLPFEPWNAETSAQKLQKSAEGRFGVKEGELFKGQTQAERAGKLWEQAAEYLAPISIGNKAKAAVSAAKFLPKLGTAGRALPYLA